MRGQLHQSFVRAARLSDFPVIFFNRRIFSLKLIISFNLYKEKHMEVARKRNYGKNEAQKPDLCGSSSSSFSYVW